jgi:hypothetical protein
VIAGVRAAVARLGPAVAYRWIGVLAIGVAAFIPLILVLIGRGPAVTLGAVVCILLGSLVIRVLIIKLPSALH